MAYDKVIDSTQLDGALTATADAIRGKTGASASIPWDMSAGFSAAIAAIPTGGGSSEPERDVNFIDYDGTIVASYTAAQFAELTALPANPSHNGLTAQGWNWTLADAKAYVADYGKLWVGQMYITSDGKTRLYINLEEGRLAPYLGVAVNGSVDVDWGDSSTHDTVTGSNLTTVINTRHTYAAAGEYVIALDATGSMALLGNDSASSQVLVKSPTASSSLNNVYQSAIKRVEIGANCTIGVYAFRRCLALSAITIPSGVTTLGNAVFRDAGAIKSITFPSGVTNIGSNFMNGCAALANAAIPKSVTSMASSAFASTRALKSIAIPSNVTSLGDYFIQTNQALSGIVIPASVTKIGAGCFNGCFGLGFIRFTRNAPPTVSGSSAWTSIPSDCVIYVPRGTLSAYKSATNYPSSSTYTYVEYDP